MFHWSISNIIKLLVKGWQRYDTRFVEIQVSFLLQLSTLFSRGKIQSEKISINFFWFLNCILNIVPHFLSLFGRTDTVINRPSYKSTMRLTINNVQKHDYGMYKCVAKNPRGETDGTIRLYCKYYKSSFGTHLPDPFFTHFNMNLEWIVPMIAYYHYFNSFLKFTISIFALGRKLAFSINYS